jgi:Gamma-glutamyl cyclotransferase, AIG2-like
LHCSSAGATNLLTGQNVPVLAERAGEAHPIMTYFFFGTLMDREVLATVLDRPVAAGELSRAWLHGYQRVRAAYTSYPILVPAPGVVVGGVAFQPKDDRDDVRIRHFEEGEYAERWLSVHLTGGCRLAARVFFALEVLQATDEAWDLAAWASAHKAAFLEQCREWMCDCAACDREPAAFSRTRR